MADWLKRWQGFRQRRSQVLTMNQRNLDYIYPNNPRSGFPYADNKLQTKALLQPHAIPMPFTHHVYDSFYGLRSLKKDLEQLSDFVIKPAAGSGGGGIVVIVDRDEDYWLSAGGRRYHVDHLKKQISDIIFGIYSFGLNDQAMIESRIIQHREIDNLYAGGLADLRIILLRHEPVMAMLRIPTDESDGKANLHQGAIGAGVDMESGRIMHAIHKELSIRRHVNSGVPLLGFEIPYWQQALAVAQQTAEAVPLKYIGVDIALSDQGPVLLEINVRPGIAIQNANDRGLAAALNRSGDQHE